MSPLVQTTATQFRITMVAEVVEPVPSLTTWSSTQLGLAAFAEPASLRTMDFAL